MHGRNNESCWAVIFCDRICSAAARKTPFSPVDSKLRDILIIISPMYCYYYYYYYDTSATPVHNGLRQPTGLCFHSCDVQRRSRLSRVNNGRRRISSAKTDCVVHISLRCVYLRHTVVIYDYYYYYRRTYIRRYYRMVLYYIVIFYE